MAEEVVTYYFQNLRRLGMFVLLAFFISSTGVVSSVTAEFTDEAKCDAAKTAIYNGIPAANKTLICVPK